jgi:ubiquinone/menaquinone biosynthesis C-methylase UbiE
MSGADFKDHFSSHAAAYALSRPGYPPALFSHLASLAPSTQLAWDCATGSGQVAIGLARHFERVIATDASAAQIEHAFGHERIVYRVEPAEATSLDPASVDLVTVGQALHWFDLDRFYTEVRRVLRPRGLVVAWCYGRCTIAPDIDAIVDRFYAEIVGPFWPPERVLVESGYQTLPLPFERVPLSAFGMHAEWTVDELLAYLGTWSATQRYASEHGHDARDEIAESLMNAWGSRHARRRIEWPLAFLVGRTA